MLSTLNELLDAVGWADKGSRGESDRRWQEHTGLIFKWMQQATVEIERLEAELKTEKEKRKRDDVRGLATLWEELDEVRRIAEGALSGVDPRTRRTF